MLQGADIVGVEVHGLLVAGVLLRHLATEALGLILGVVELGKAVGEFAAADVELEAVGDEGILIVAPRQG